MQPCSQQFADYVRQRTQTPIGFAVVQLPKPDTGTTWQNPPVFTSQMVIDKLSSVEISRSTDRTSDTAKFTLQDDTLSYSGYRTDGSSKYGAAFKPGLINNRFNLYLGFQGRNYENLQGQSGSTNITNWEYATLLRFIGNLQTDDNPYKDFSNTKSASLIDMTNRFRFDVYDTFPHPLYGDQTLPYFDPSYNLTNNSNDGVTWTCIGKMFTTSNLSLVYGSTHIPPSFFIDFTCGQTPQNTALNFDHSTIDSTTFVGTYYDSSNNVLWTFDYPGGKITFTDAWITKMLQSGQQGGQIAKLTSGVNIGDKSFSVNLGGNFVAGGTLILGMPDDPHQESLTISSVNGNTVKTTQGAAHTHSSGDPAMGNWTVSVAGNPTYMSPEQMIYLILVTKGNWDPTMLKMDTSNVIINQYVAQDKPAWDCIKEICDLTCPRFLPWIMYVDLAGVIHFEEVMYDAPTVKKYIDKRDFLDCDLSYSSQNISTVVRAEGECYTDEGNQSVTSLAFNMTNIYKYGQTQPLLLDQHLTYNCRQLSTTQAVAFMNMLTSSVLAQVSQPTLTLTADIWPDPTIDINDKIQVKDTDTGLDEQFVITAINERVDPGAYSMKITAQKCIHPANYMLGLPAGVTYDNLLLPAKSAIPSTSLVKEIRLGSGPGVYVYKDWAPVQDPVTLDDIVGVWKLDGSAMRFDVFYDAKKPPAGSSNPYSYRNLPPNCNWAPSQDPNTGQTVFYGVQPSPNGLGSPNHAGWTLYVGPDSVFYTFNHSPPITPADLGSFWLPPGNGHGVGGGTGTQAWDGYQWCWFYLCLDGNTGGGKFHRPVMRINPTQDGVQFHVPANAGTQINNTWNNPPGPTFDGKSYYYGNLVVGCSNLAFTPTGFVGAQPFKGQGQNNKGRTHVNWPDGNHYWSDSHGNGGPGWMPPGTNPVPVADPTSILPGDKVQIGTGGNQENNVPISQVSVSASTITIDSSYNGGGGTTHPHYGGPQGQPDSSGHPPAPIIVTGKWGGSLDNVSYGVAYGNPIAQQDWYVNYDKITLGMFCLYVISTDGASQFIRVPFKVYL